MRSRVADAAPDLDQASGLVMFAHGLREAGADGVTAHRYLLASVWANTARMSAYLWDEGGFERVRAQYGGAHVRTWPLAGLQLDRAALSRADRLEVGVGPPQADTALSVLAGRARDAADKAMSSKDIHAAVRGVDPGTGATLSIDVRTARSRDPQGADYELLHLSVPDPQQR